jgi:hypothetical protein
LVWGARRRRAAPTALLLHTPLIDHPIPLCCSQISGGGRIHTSDVAGVADFEVLRLAAAAWRACDVASGCPSRPVRPSRDGTPPGRAPRGPCGCQRGRTVLLSQVTGLGVILEGDAVKCQAYVSAITTFTHGQFTPAEYAAREKRFGGAKSPSKPGVDPRKVGTTTRRSASLRTLPAEEQRWCRPYPSALIGPPRFMAARSSPG